MNDGQESAATTSPEADATDSEHAHPHSSGSAMEDRMERLLTMLVWVGDHDVALGLRSLSPGELSLQPLAIRTALQALRRKRDPVSFLGQPQYRPTVPLVAEAVAEACQDAVISALGEDADNPDRAQLLAAVEEVKASFPVSTIALMLAFVSVTNMEAADLCDEILQSEDMFVVPSSVPGAQA
jgi:hypothetical protein